MDGPDDYDLIEVTTFGQAEPQYVLGMRRGPTEADRVAAMLSGDPYGVVTIAGARRLYVRGDIEVDEFERRVEAILVAEETGQPVAGVAWLNPGERVLPTRG